MRSSYRSSKGGFVCDVSGACDQVIERIRIRQT